MTRSCAQRAKPRRTACLYSKTQFYGQDPSESRHFPACEGKMEMSPSGQSRNVPFLVGPFELETLRTAGRQVYLLSDLLSDLAGAGVAAAGAEDDSFLPDFSDFCDDSA